MNKNEEKETMPANYPRESAAISHIQRWNCSAEAHLNLSESDSIQQPFLRPHLQQTPSASAAAGCPDAITAEEGHHEESLMALRLVFFFLRRLPRCV